MSEPHEIAAAVQAEWIMYGRENAEVDLRGKRLEQGLTLKQLAELCQWGGVSVSVSEISRIERSIHAPRPALRKTLAELLDVPITDFGDWP